jgi:hypothetical protein
MRQTLPLMTQTLPLMTLIRLLCADLMGVKVRVAHAEGIGPAVDEGRRFMGRRGIGALVCGTYPPLNASGAVIGYGGKESKVSGGLRYCPKGQLI